MEKSRAIILATAKPPKQNASKDEQHTLKNLQRNKIVNLPADKGNTTVVLDNKEYEEKASEILSKPPSTKLAKDTTKHNESRVNDRLKRLFTKGAITKETDYKCVSSNGSRTQLFYRLVKIHKHFETKAIIQRGPIEHEQNY